MTGVVFCDEAGKAFKVARGRPEESSVVAEEAAYLRQATKIPGVREHVARGVRYDDKERVLVRECVRPSPKRDRRVNEKRLFDLHQRIASRMKRYGWGSPEYKPDSYVYTRDRGPVLVDAGFAHRRGQALVEHVLDLLNERKPWPKYDRPTDVAWALRMERGDSVPEVVANKLLARLKAIDPNVET
jgi:hypothetical protein